MAKYNPIKISGFETGLVKDREDFLLVEDAFPTLENAYIFREKILKKRGKEFYGRLRRSLSQQTLAVTGASPYTDSDVLSTLSLRATEADAQIQCGQFVIVLDRGGADETTIEDASGLGTLTLQLVPASANTMGFTAGTINYTTGAISLAFSALTVGVTVDITFKYYPSLPVMGLRTRELNTINDEEVIAFDTKYAYTHTSTTNWQEAATAGTTWSGTDSNFFYSTNYWVDASNNKLFWATNFTSGAGSDPIRYFNGTSWTNFIRLTTTLDSLYSARIIIPFRGRLLALNTYEGLTAGGSAASVQYGQRIRWSQIGTPLATDSWQQTVRGKGSFLDIPTSEHIVSAGFVRDNLVIYCERSTWQLRYVGRDITPFQIERVNNELGSDSTFSSVTFDKALVGIGDKRIVSCDSFSSEPIDIKIPDFAINIENENDGNKRVYGIRDIQKHLSFWAYTSNDGGEFQGKFPNKVLVYNDENDSWAIFKDSVTCFGYVWLTEDPTWDEVGDMTWEQYNLSWSSQQKNEPIVISGNQQGFVHKNGVLISNDQSLQIKAITGNVTTPTTISSPNHNLAEGDIIYIINIPTGTPFASSLNDKVFYVSPSSNDLFELYTYDSTTDSWDNPQLDAAGTYIGCGEIKIRDNFRVLTKKFHHMDEGKKIQIGYIDALLEATDDSEIQYKVYADYQNDVSVNVNDGFFNTRVPTYGSDFDIIGASKYWHRIFTQQNASFLQIEFSLSNSQMNGNSAITDVQIHAMIIWERMAGRITN